MEPLLTASEKDIFRNFQAATQDLNLDEATLLRFFVARDCDMKSAEDMTRKSVKWRNDNAIHLYANWDPPAVLAEDLIIKMSGLDFEGYPVIWVPFGNWNYRKWVEEGYREDLIKFRYHMLEKFSVEAAKVSQTRSVLLLDLEGLTYWKISHFETLQLAINSFQDMEQNYPETIKSIVVINAPWLYSMAFNIVKPIMSSHSLSKMVVYKSDKSKWLPELQKLMPNSAIPSKYFD